MREEEKRSGDPVALREALVRREEGLRRFAAWAGQRPCRIDSPAEAIACVATLFELLPAESRTRNVDATGVMTMHRLLGATAPRR